MGKEKNGRLPNNVDQNVVPTTKTKTPDTNTQASATKANGSTAGSRASIHETEDAPDLRCGYGSCKPSWLQRCNNPKAFLCWLCWFSIIQGFVVNGINNVNTSTLERRFTLQSSSVSLISSMYDISAGLFVLPITYWGATSHQPRMLAIACLVMSIGSVIMALPQWTTAPYELGQSIADTCDISGSNVTYCDTYIDTGLSNYLYMFMFGQFLHGVGGTTLYSIGIVFIDNNVIQKNSPLYQGVMYAFAALGPALGYIIGGALLDIYVDVGRVDLDTINAEPSDPRFVGAWWIGFITSGGLAFTCFLGLLPYAFELPHAEKARASRVSQVHQDGSEEKAARSGFGTTIKDLPASLKMLLSNPVNMLVTMAGISEGLITSGFSTFMPKFIQSQYGQTASMAAYLGGGMAVPGAAGGQLLGGAICRMGKLKVRGMLIMCIILSIISLFLSGLLFAQCQRESIAGVSVDYFNINSEIQMKSEVNLSHPCNAGCGCTSRSYEPVCGVDGIQYFTSCHAGCLNTHGSGNEQKFGNCSCINTTQSDVTTASSIEYEATLGGCSQSCDMMYVFLPLFLLIIGTTFMVAVPGLNISLRCIPDSQRSFGLGVKWVFIRFLGTVPGPIMYGALFDTTCILWQDKCGEKGSCWLYDNANLSIRVFIIVVCLKVVSLTLFSIAYCVYKPPPKETDSKDIGFDNPALDQSGESSVSVAANQNVSNSNPAYRNNGQINDGFVDVDLGEGTRIDKNGQIVTEL